MSNYSIALSGLSAQASALNIVSDNLANLNTTGFKGSSASFHDLVTQAMSSSTPNGAGVSAVTAKRSFNQGSIQITSGAFDAAIEGNGFFVVQNTQGQQLYTRAGNFSLNSAGNLVNANGDFVLGWPRTNGTVNASGAPGTITIPAGSVAPAATTKFSLDANLNAAAATGDTFSTPVQVVDSLGTRHTLTVKFTKTAPGWHYEVSIPDADLSSPSTTPLGKGDLTFDSTGKLTAPDANTAQTVTIPKLADGADFGPNPLTFNLYSPDGKTATITQYAQTSAVSAINADGTVAAQLSQVSLSDGGMLVAQYSNGTQQIVAQIALAGISNPESLIATGENNFALGAGSAAPAIGAAGTGGRGQIKASALEGSNVDIATEFTMLMTFQRSYQADSRAITTQDQITQDLMQMKP